MQNPQEKIIGLSWRRVVIALLAFAIVTTYLIFNRLNQHPIDKDSHGPLGSYRIDPNLPRLDIDVMADSRIIVDGRPRSLQEVRALLTDAKKNGRAVSVCKMSTDASDESNQQGFDALIFDVGIVTQLRFKPIAEQPGPAQPATQPADEDPVKDQPATPTSKDAPR